MDDAARNAPATKPEPGSQTVNPGRSPAVTLDLPDELPITPAERRLVAAYFGAVIARILAEDP